MKKNSLFCCVVAILFAVHVSANVDTTRVYLVDAEVVKHFDGKILEGKTIKLYEIKYQKTPTGVKEMHIIMTGKDVTKIIIPSEEYKVAYDSTKQIRSIVTQTNPLIILDGKEFRGNFKDLLPEQKASPQLLKSGSKAAAKYGKEASEKGVMLISSRQDYICVVDGVEMSKEDMKKISPDTILNMVIHKKGSEAAVQYGERGKTHNIILITTKK